MNSLRDILVVLDDTARSDVRLTIGVRLAQQHEAHLTGISALDLVTPPRHVPRFDGYLEGDPRGPPHLMTRSAMAARDYPQMEKGVAEIAEQIEVAFRTHLRSSGLRGEWRTAGQARHSRGVRFFIVRSKLTIRQSREPDPWQR